MKKESFDKNLFAPCGADCNVCYRHLSSNLACKGCLSDDKNKPKSCVECKIKACVKDKNINYCYECSEFPCSQIKNLDNSYLTRYGISILRNSNITSSHGKEYFYEKEEEYFTCPECSGIINLTDNRCSQCGKKFNMRNHILSKFSLEELWELFPIEIKNHSKSWKKYYSEEAEHLKNLLGDTIRVIYHYGSTSVEGLKAKLIIDIMLTIKKDTDIQKLIEILKEDGYIPSPQPGNPPPQMMLMKGYTLGGFKRKTYHLHLRYSTDQDELYFRDYLIKHEDAKKEYENLKLELAKEYKHDRDAYTNAKANFIKKITAMGREEFFRRYEEKR